MEVNEDNNFQQLQKHYEEKLSDLQQNETTHFTIINDVECKYPLELHESDFTIEQWNCLFTELKKNSSVEIVDVELRCCPVECLGCFVDYIGTSPTLKDVIIKYVSLQDYDEFDYDEEELPSKIPKKYRAKIDDILRAARQNPSIQNLHLHCLGHGEAIKDLLVGNASLKKFELSMYKYDNTCRAMAESIAAGFKGNNALHEICLSVHQDISFADEYFDDDYLFGAYYDNDTDYEDRGRLDIMISGLCHHGHDSSSNLESLYLYHQSPESNPELDARILEAIKCTPSLKTLVLDGDDHEWTPGGHAWSASVLHNLRGPEYAGLKTLELRGVTLGTSHYCEKDTMPGSDQIWPSDQVNMTLERLCLRSVTFHHQKAMRLLWKLRGLRQLDIVSSNMSSKWIEEEYNRNAPDYWAESFCRCTQLCQVNVHLDNYDPQCDDDVCGMFTSILNGARGHNVLQSLKLSAENGMTIIGSSDAGVAIPEGRLRLLLQQVLRETSCLKVLSIMNIGPQDDLASGLAQGLRENKSLKKLDFKMKHMKPSNFRTILESLFDNQTLQHVGHNSPDCWADKTYKSQTSGEICEILGRLFRVNASLRHIGFPPLDLRGQNMHALLEGWHGNNATLKSLDMLYCQTDDVGVRFLGQALAKTVQLERIVLPRGSRDYQTGFKDFLGSIAQMRHVKTLDLAGSFENLRDNHKKFLTLLLNATQKNKQICSFGLENYNNDPLVSEIEYYLKLNRSGRHILDTPSNVLQKLWPAILARVASNPEDTNVLFFFIRQYFMRNSYPLRRQPPRQQQQQGQNEIPPPKRARVHDGESGDKGGFL